eukprot:COSAG01_NODE_23616_length_808_cov_1.610719_1_plen_49_part_10
MTAHHGAPGRQPASTRTAVGGSYGTSTTASPANRCAAAACVCVTVGDGR